MSRLPCDASSEAGAQEMAMYRLSTCRLRRQARYSQSACETGCNGCLKLARSAVSIRLGLSLETSLFLLCGTAFQFQTVTCYLSPIGMLLSGFMLQTTNNKH